MNLVSYKKFVINIFFVLGVNNYGNVIVVYFC